MEQLLYGNCECCWLGGLLELLAHYEAPSKCTAVDSTHIGSSVYTLCGVHTMRTLHSEVFDTYFKQSIVRVFKFCVVKMTS